MINLVGWNVRSICCSIEIVGYNHVISIHNNSEEYSFAIHVYEKGDQHTCTDEKFWCLNDAVEYVLVKQLGGDYANQ